MTPRTRSSLRRSLAAATAAGLLTLSACSSGSDTSSADSGGAARGSMDAPQAAADAEAADGVGVESLNATSRSVDAGEPVEKAAEPERAVISTGNVVLRADDVAAARFDVREVVDRYAGDVTEDTTDADDEGEITRARLVVRVPEDDFEAAVEDLRKVADEVSVATAEKDVTDQVIDTRVRLRVQQRSIRRIELLLDRAQTIRDIVAIEGQLARREAELNSLTQRAANLADQTEMATITVSLRQTPPPKKAAVEDEDGFVAGLSAGWGALVAFGVWLATVSGALLPWAVVLSVLALVLWPVVRRARRRGGPVPAAAGVDG